MQRGKKINGSKIINWLFSLPFLQNNHILIFDEFKSLSFECVI